MGKISVNNTALDKYFRLLSLFDNSSKKQLILKLTASLEVEEKDFDLKSLFGAWEDTRDSDQIIKDILEARVNNRETEDFE